MGRIDPNWPNPPYRRLTDEVGREISGRFPDFLSRQGDFITRKSHSNIKTSPRKAAMTIRKSAPLNTAKPAMGFGITSFLYFLPYKHLQVVPNPFLMLIRVILRIPGPL